MPIGDLLDDLLSRGGSGVQGKVFECADCGNTFESAKQPERAQCPECLSNETSVVGTADMG